MPTSPAMSPCPATTADGCVRCAPRAATASRTASTPPAATRRTLGDLIDRLDDRPEVREDVEQVFDPHHGHIHHVETEHHLPAALARQIAGVTAHHQDR